MSREIEPAVAEEIIEFLKSEVAFLKGKIEVYEKFLKSKGHIKEKE